MPSVLRTKFSLPEYEGRIRVSEVKAIYGAFKRRQAAYHTPESTEQVIQGPSKAWFLGIVKEIPDSLLWRKIGAVLLTVCWNDQLFLDLINPLCFPFKNLLDIVLEFGKFQVGV